jgi:cellulose 1,4-beta-cellobiosidase
MKKGLFVLGAFLCLVLVGCTRTTGNLPPLPEFRVSAETASVFQPMEFDASNSSDPDGEIVEFLWDFGDGETATGVVVVHIYTAPGEYTVTLTVRDNQGAQATAQKKIAVVEGEEPAPPLVALFTVSAEEVEPFEEIVFDASSSVSFGGEIIQYLWDFGDEGEDEGMVVVYSYAEVGVYRVTLTVRDNRGFEAKARKDIRVRELPGEG